MKLMLLKLVKVNQSYQQLIKDQLGRKDFQNTSKTMNTIITEGECDDINLNCPGF